MKTEGKTYYQILQQLQPYCNPPVFCVRVPCSSLQGQCYVTDGTLEHQTVPQTWPGCLTTISTFNHKLLISQSPRETEGAKGKCKVLWFSSSTYRSGTTETPSPRSNSHKRTHNTTITYYCLYLLGWHCLVTVKSYNISPLLHTNQKLWFTFYFLISI